MNCKLNGALKDVKNDAALIAISLFGLAIEEPDEASVVVGRTRSLDMTRGEKFSGRNVKR